MSQLPNNTTGATAPLSPAIEAHRLACLYNRVYASNLWAKTATEKAYWGGLLANEGNLSPIAHYAAIESALVADLRALTDAFEQQLIIDVLGYDPDELRVGAPLAWAEGD